MQMDNSNVRVRIMIATASTIARARAIMVSLHTEGQMALGGEREEDVRCRSFHCRCTNTLCPRRTESQCWIFQP